MGISQFVLVVLLLFAMNVLGGFRVVLIPAILAMFFLPAVGRLLYELKQARDTLRYLDRGTHAFETIVQPIDSERPK